MGDISKVAVVVAGVMTLHFDGGKELVLQDCLYVPKVRRNFVSIPSLSFNAYSYYLIKLLC